MNLVLCNDASAQKDLDNRISYFQIMHSKIGKSPGYGLVLTCLLLIFFFFSEDCWSQQYYFKNYTGDDGLSQIVGTELFQDRDGYIWIGTQAGLNRFDGNKFEIFSIQQGLNNDRINSITQDNSGRIWIGTNGGLSSYQAGKFHNYSLNDGLPNQHVLDLAVDSTGMLWCATIAGLCRWDGKKFYTFSEKGGLEETVPSHLAVDNKGLLWVGTTTGLYYLDKNQFRPFENIESRSIYALAGDKQNRLWVGLSDQVKVFSDKGQVAVYSKEDGLHGLPMSICVGRDGIVWVGTDEGIVKIQKGDLEFIDDSNGLPFRQIRSVLEDREGILWLAGISGVAKFQGRAFTNYTTTDGLGANHVFQILRDHKGVLWAATVGGLSRFEEGKWRNFTTEDGLYHNYVWPLLVDKTGRLWIGTQGGINYFEAGHFFRDSDARTEGIVHSIVQDSSGTIWCALRGKGLFQRIEANRYEQVVVPDQSFSWPSLLADSRGFLWASGDYGLSKWNGQSWRTFTISDGLASNEPYYLCEDHLGRIWFGYRSSHGVTYYDGHQFTTLTTKDGLFNDAVYSIGVDKKNNIWIGTARGVDRFDGKNFVNFGKAEGYASYESNAGGFFADADGTLWFGTGEGLSHYNPSYSIFDDKPIAPRINQIKIEDQEVRGSSPLSLPYSQNDLQIRISPLTYSNPKRLSYRYRLLGYNDSWKSMTGYDCDFTNLPPGDFTFQVQGRKYFGEWSAPAELSITISPPFWRTWWFFTVSLLILITIVVAIIYLRTKSLENQRKKLEQVINERTRDLRRLSKVVSETDNAVIIADAAGEISWINQGFTKMYGFSLEELKGKNIIEIGSNPDIQKHVQTSITKQKSVTYNSVSPTKDGKELHLSSTLTPIVDQRGKLENLVVIDMDITELKRQEKDLKIAQFSIERAGDAVFWIKPGGYFFYVNRKACTNLGYKREELLTMRVHDITDAYQNRDFNEIWEAVKEANSLTFESKHIRKDGSTFPVDVMANFLEYDGQEYIFASTRDITERQRTENALRESQQRFHLLAESAFEGIGITDRGKLIEVNKRLSEMLGYTEEELVGMDPLEFVIPEERDMVLQYRNQGYEEPYEHIAVRKDGSTFPVEVQAKSMAHEGRVFRVAAVRDITERRGIEQELTALNELLLKNEKELSAANQQLTASLKQVKAQEKVLRESEQKYRTLFNQIADPIFIFDKDTKKFLDCNHAVSRVYGYSKDELKKMTPMDLHPPEELEKVEQNLEKKNVDKANSYVHLTKNGKRIAVEILTDEIEYQDHHAWMSIVRDITERKDAADELRKLNEKLSRSEQELSAANQQLMASLQQLKAHDEALRESQERLRLIIDTAHDAVVVIDENGLITNWNKQAENIFGRSRSEVLRKPMANILIPEKFRQAYKQGLKKYLESGVGRFINNRNEAVALRRNGEEFPIELTVTPLRLGESTTFSAFIRDITDTKKAQEEIKLAKERAESANRELRQTNQHLEQATLLAKEMAIQAELASGAKSEFLANMSHEIRTPLNAIIGMTELTLETQLSPEQRGYLNVVQSSSEGLLCLINDILDFSKIEAGQMQIEHIDFDIREVIEGVAEMLSTRASAKNIELLCYAEANIEQTLVGDPTRLRQILINLTGNAIKFTEKGEVVIKVEIANKMDASIELHFKVSDTGIGISSEKIEKIFEKFSQEDTSTTRKFGGTGLGLNISKSLVELMGGKLWVESEEGKGSTFQFKLTLPISKTEEDEPTSIKSDLQGIKILLVDDNQTNRFILKTMMENWGIDVLQAESGVQAQTILKKSARKSIDLAIIDQKMPEMDGLELIRRIRDQKSNQGLKLILLSALVGLSKEQQQELNIAETILKPVKQSNLFDAISRVVSNQSSSAENFRDGAGQESEKKRACGNILLVEDNISNQKLTKKILEKNGHQVKIAENGLVAVEAFIKYRYDLILMDIYMPEMDGFEATTEIREWEHKHSEDRIPIIALTAHAIEGYREKCLEQNMDDFITKPIKKKILLDTIEKWLDPRPVILVVDDSPDNRHLLIRHIQNEGSYRYVVAENGKVAVQAVKRRKIDFVLMDIEMPVMNGYSATSAIRRLENGKELPIIALTAHNEKRNTDKCLQVGCTSVLPKPVRKKMLFEVLNRFLKEPSKVHRIDEEPQLIHDS